MRKAILIAALLLCAFFLGAQAIDLSQVELSKIQWDTALFSLAGPDKMYVRNVGYAGIDQTFSMIVTFSFAQDGQLLAAFSAPTDAGMADAGEVAFAQAVPEGNTLKISPVITEDGKAYAAYFALDGVKGGKLVDYKEITDTVYPSSIQNLLMARVQLKNMVNNMTAQAAADKAAADKAKADTAAASKAALDKAVADTNAAKADADAAKKATAAAQADADQAKKDAAVAKTTADQLKMELTLVKSQAGGKSVIPQVDPAKLNFSMVRASVAGPNALYLRNIMYAGEPVSILLNISADGSVVAAGPYFAEQKLIQDSDEVAYLSVSASGAYSIELSPVLVGGQAYSGIMEWTPGTNQFTILSYKPIAMPVQYEEMAVALAGAKKQAADAQAGVASAKADADKAKADADALKKQVADLTAKLDAASKVVAAPAAAAAAPAAAAAAAPAYEKPSMAYVSSAASDAPAFIQKALKDGKAPDTALPLYGSWSLTAAGNVVQSDAGLKFAKAPVALPQTQSEILYQFIAKATVGDWTGYGLHFQATGVTQPIAYGFGNSYLVWITRDLNYYKIPTTYVQIYRSYDDIKMVQLASVNIPESIGDALTTEIVYNAGAKTINVSVNGVSRLAYAVDSALTKGDMVALRTLGGPVEFSYFGIKTR